MRLSRKNGLVIYFSLFYFFTFLPLTAQSVKDIIQQKPDYASCNYCVYPIT